MNVAIERTPDGRRLVVSRAIDVPAETVWNVLTDTRYWPDWGPSVTAVECDERFVRAGTRGYIRTAGLGSLLPDRLVSEASGSGGLKLPFRVVDCENHRWTWAVAGIPATGHRVEAMEEGCRTAIEIPLPAAAYAPVCWRALESIERIALETPE